jgi:hypothetical protein
MCFAVSINVLPWSLMFSSNYKRFAVADMGHRTQVTTKRVRISPSRLATSPPRNFSIFFYKLASCRDAKLRAARGGGLVSPAQFSV